MNNHVLRDISYGMYIVSLKGEVGCFINTLTQITAQNPIISISLNKENYTNEMLKQEKKFAISILSENTRPEVISQFGFFSSREVKKFEDVEKKFVEGIPVITENTCGYLIAEVMQIIDCETHDVFIARVLDAEKLLDQKPMTYQYYHEVIRGKAPKQAPTYVEEKIEGCTTQGFSKYQCIVCGHIYDEAVEGVKFDDLPDDWVCPICHVGKEQFQKIA